MRYFEIVLLEKLLSPDEMLARLEHVRNLVDRGATEGERSAARNAFAQLTRHVLGMVDEMLQPDSGVPLEEITRFCQKLQKHGISVNVPNSAAGSDIGSGQKTKQNFDRRDAGMGQDTNPDWRDTNIIYRPQPKPWNQRAQPPSWRNRAR